MGAFLIHLVKVVGRENSENSETMNIAKYMLLVLSLVLICVGSDGKPQLFQRFLKMLGDDGDYGNQNELNHQNLRYPLVQDQDQFTHQLQSRQGENLIHHSDTSLDNACVCRCDCCDCCPCSPGTEFEYVDTK